MKKRMFLLLVPIALYLSSSAQLPRIEIRGNDTSAVIPLRDMRIANAKFVELKGCREENDSLFSQVRAYTGLTNNLRASITELKEVNKHLNQISYGCIICICIGRGRIQPNTHGFWKRRIPYSP